MLINAVLGRQRREDLWDSLVGKQPTWWSVSKTRWMAPEERQRRFFFKCTCIHISAHMYICTKETMMKEYTPPFSWLEKEAYCWAQSSLLHLLAFCWASRPMSVCEDSPFQRGRESPLNWEVCWSPEIPGKIVLEENIFPAAWPSSKWEMKTKPNKMKGS